MHMIGSAHHYGVTVSDLDRSLAFYRDRLGMEVVDRLSLDGDAFGRFVGVEGADVDIVLLDADGCRHELLDYRSQPGENVTDGAANTYVGAAQFCLEVEFARVAGERRPERPRVLPCSTPPAPTT
jgi:catechol 2,3-dioxygenase-like lactoylglutathione lyase family enzyme